MTEDPKTASWSRGLDIDQNTPDQRVRSGRVRTTSWMDRLLVVLYPSLLSLSVFSVPVLSGSHLAILLGVGAGVFYTSSTNGSTTERITQRRVALFLVILLNIYLISLADGSSPVLSGRTLVRLGSLMGFALFALWVIRLARRGRFRIIRSPVDVAVLLLLLLTSVGFLGLSVLLRINGLPIQVKSDLLWIVLSAALLYYMLSDFLHTESAINRTLRLSLFPVAAVCVLAPISFWLTR
jgi:hypothetical protein